MPRKRSHLICEAPEEEGHHDRPPQLGHDVEQAEGPVAQNGDGARKACARLCQEVLAEPCAERFSAGQRTAEWSQQT